MEPASQNLHRLVGTKMQVEIKDKNTHRRRRGWGDPIADGF